MDKMLSLLQASSGLAFSAFTLLHLGGHSLAPFGYRFAEQALYASREVYQAPWFEPWLIGLSLVLHAGTSGARYLIRQRRLASSSAAQKEGEKRESPALVALSLHRNAGHIVALIVFVHVFASRIAPLLCMSFLLLESPNAQKLSGLTQTSMIPPLLT